MTEEPPFHLRDSVGMLVSYLTRAPSVPFLALGEFGFGRGHWIEQTLVEHGYRPAWIYDSEESFSSHDLDGNRLFPVYDLPEIADRASFGTMPEWPPVIPCIVLAPTNFPRAKEEWKKAEFTTFFPPPEAEIRRFLASFGVPEELAVGNPTYSAAELAARAYRATGLHTTAEAPRSKQWSEFRKGAPPPVDDTLLPYYASYALPPPYEWETNGLLGLRRKVPTSILSILIDSVRAVWPAKEPIFPEILKTPKAPRGFRSDPPKDQMTDIIPRTKAYSIDW